LPSFNVYAQSHKGSSKKHVSKAI